MVDRPTVDPPIACQLDVAAARAQVGEWQELLADDAVTTERGSPNELSVHFGASRLATVVDLAQREKACCPFFEFSIGIEADALVLFVAVPTEAAAVLDRLVDSTT
jgi:MerR family transcriptional regulator, copper efflux regulator